MLPILRTRPHAGRRGLTESGTNLDRMCHEPANTSKLKRSCCSNGSCKCFHFPRCVCATEQSFFEIGAYIKQVLSGGWQEREQILRAGISIYAVCDRDHPVWNEGEYTAWYVYRMSMQDEYQSASPQSPVVENTYSFLDEAPRALAKPLSMDGIPSRLLRYWTVKRCLDILLVVISAPLTLPILAIISMAVKLSSTGPVFYSHRRIRRRGAFFSMWKFRTMCVNSSEVLEDYLRKHSGARREWNRTHKLRHDPRVNAVGLFLRRYSLDELPQLWNVLVGQMTLVGPRPIVAAEVERYGNDFSYYCRVKPGLTGLWQVSGRSELTYAQRVALDREYVEHWSLWKDFVILLRTFLAVANQDGAY